MNKSPLLLSICIPTYNRSEYLNVAIKSIVEQDGFDERTEIVIVDNCSTDNTALVVNEFMTIYNNIKYHCNDINIGLEGNIIKSLDIANGKYLKLFNDYIIFEPGALGLMLKLIENEKNEERNIFFLNGNFPLREKKKDDLSYYVNLNEFICHASYWITWISCFGVWKKKYNTIKDKSNYSGLLFFHTQVFMELLKKDSRVIVYNKYIFNKQNVESKTGYDLFYVFLNNFKKTILFSLYENKYITKKTYNAVSYGLFKRLIFPWFKKLDAEDSKNFNFDNKRALNLIFDEYKYNLYFYINISLYRIGKFLKSVSLVLLPKGVIQDCIIKIVNKV